MKEIIDKYGNTIALEENSKPVIIKRIASVLFDVGVLFVCFFAFYSLINVSPMASSAHYYQNQMLLIVDENKLSSGYGYKEYCQDDQDYSNYIIHTDEQGDKYIVKDFESPSQEIITAFQNALNNSEDLINARFSYNLRNYFLALFCFGLLELVFFLIIPLFNKKRATIAMLLFKISLFSKKYEEHAHWYHVILRFLFILIVESALPYLWLANYTFLIVPVINFIIIILNKNNSTIRDFITRTRYIEEASYLPVVESD